MRSMRSRLHLGIAPDRAPVRWWEATRMHSGSGRLSERIARVKEYVSDRSAEVAGLDELADMAGLSRYHFVRVFREEVGQTPWSYVREQRVQRAIRLLEEGIPPAEVAYEAGFADQSHLTRTLRDVAGRTPGEVRRGRQKAEDSEVEERNIVQDSSSGPNDHEARTIEDASWSRTSKIESFPR